MRSSSSIQLKRERLHLRIEPRLLGDVREICERRGVTVTSLVEAGLRLVVQAEVEKGARSVIDAEQV